MRKFIQFILICFLTILLLVGSVLTPVTLSVLSSKTYKNSLKEADVYKEATNTFTDEIINNIYKQIEEELLISYGRNISLGENLKNELNLIIKTSLQSILTQDIIQKTIEQNIENGFNFINSTDKSLMIYIPGETIVDKLSQEIPQIIVKTENTIGAFPVCLPSDLEQAGLTSQSTLDCIPQSVKDTIFNEKTFDVINNLDLIVLELQRKNKLLAKDGEITIEEFLDAIDTDNSSDAQLSKPVEDLNQLRNIIKGIKIFLLIFWIIVISLIILLWIAFEKPKSAKISKVILVIIVSELLVLIPMALFKYVVLQKILNPNFIDDYIDLKDISSKAIEVILNLCTSYLENIANNIMLFSGIIILAGLIIYLFSKLALRRTSPKTSI